MTETTADSITRDEEHGHGGHGHDHEDAVHAANPHLQHHFDTPQQQFDAGKLGIWIFLVTEVLFFSGLFCAYTIYRAEHPEVFIFAHYYLSAWLGGVNTAVLILSSLTAAWAVRNAQLRQHRLLVVNILITIACASTFIVIHAHEYYEHYQKGLMWTDCEQSNGKPLQRLRFGVCFKPKEHVWELPSFKAEHPESAGFAEKLYEEEQAQGKKKAALAAPAAGTDKVQFASLTLAQARAGRTVPVASSVPAPGGAAPAKPAAAAPTAKAEGEPAKKAAKKPAKKAEAAPGASAMAAAPAASGSAAPAASGSAAPAASGSAAPAASGSAAAPGASAEAAPSASAPAPAAAQPAPAPASAEESGKSVQEIEALATEEARSGVVETELGKKMKPLIDAGVIGPRSAGGVSYPKEGHVFFALYFFMTGLHSLHVFIGIIVWLWMLTKALKKEFGPTYFGPIDYSALYWHLVDMIWIYLFPLLYLIR